MSDQYIGELRQFGFNFAPYGWAQCLGQLLSIRQFTALFSILGTNFGGDGSTNFGLPNLQGVVPIGAGLGPGLSDFLVGDAGGTGAVTLTLQQITQHNHGFPASTSLSANVTPANASFRSNAHGPGGRGNEPPIRTYSTTVSGAGTTQMASNMIANAGSSGAHTNLQPYLCMNWCIALQGIYPPRN